MGDPLERRIAPSAQRGYQYASARGRGGFSPRGAVETITATLQDGAPGDGRRTRRRACRGPHGPRHRRSPVGRSACLTREHPPIRTSPAHIATSRWALVPSTRVVAVGSRRAPASDCPPTQLAIPAVSHRLSCAEIEGSAYEPAQPRESVDARRAFEGHGSCIEVAVSPEKHRDRPGCSQPRSDLDQIPIVSIVAVRVNASCNARMRAM
jgi:hypothetical protein